MEKISQTTGAAGMVFDIQRFALHDGPGIRTTVFLSGCNNRCRWCHNPESLTIAPQLQYYPHRCNFCGICTKICHNHNFIDEEHVLNRGGCTGCGKCAGHCNTQTLVISGKPMAVSEVMAVVLEDRAFYKQSGGGVTLSGGEPVLQDCFCRELLSMARSEGLHTTLQTAGNYPYQRLASLLSYLDLILFDIKAISDEIYKLHIGDVRDIILKNLKQLDEEGVPLVVRTPVIGGVNDNEDEIREIAVFVSGLKNLSDYQLLPYHSLGKAKYEALGKIYDVPYTIPSKGRIAELKNFAVQYINI